MKMKKCKSCTWFIMMSFCNGETVDRARRMCHYAWKRCEDVREDECHYKEKREEVEE